MTKLKDIANKVLKTEGGKLFGPRALRVSTSEMKSVFEELREILYPYFNRIELSRALKSKVDHGDIDIVLLNDKGINVFDILKKSVGDRVIEYSKNGNIYSVLYTSPIIKKSVHVDFLVSGTQDEFDPQWEYLSYNDFSGILGVFSRRLRFNYGTHGFFKIYIDKSGRYHYIHITNDLRKGLKILGYSDVEKYDKIETLDDIISFISSSPLFSSEYYAGNEMNHSDRKRVRAGRPSADYIRKKLIDLNVRNTIEDEDYFFKSLYPVDYEKYLKAVHEIENRVIPKSKYNGEWIMKNFPFVRPGPLVGQILKFWFETYGNRLDSVSEEELLRVTDKFLPTELSNK